MIACLRVVTGSATALRRGFTWTNWLCQPIHQSGTNENGELPFLSRWESLGTFSLRINGNWSFSPCWFWVLDPCGRPIKFAFFLHSLHPSKNITSYIHTYVYIYSPCCNKLFWLGPFLTTRVQTLSRSLFLHVKKKDDQPFWSIPSRTIHTPCGLPNDDIFSFLYSVSLGKLTVRDRKRVDYIPNHTPRRRVFQSSFCCLKRRKTSTFCVSW